MITATIICVLTAALLGGIMLSYLLQGKPIPKGMAFVHGPLAATGLIILIIYAFTTTNQYKYYESIALFAVAAVGGIVLFYRDLTGKKLPKWLGVAHGLIALTGIAFILYHTLSGH